MMIILPTYTLNFLYIPIFNAKSCLTFQTKMLEVILSHAYFKNKYYHRPKSLFSWNLYIYYFMKNNYTWVELQSLSNDNIKALRCQNQS